MIKGPIQNVSLKDITLSLNIISKKFNYHKFIFWFDKVRVTLIHFYNGFDNLSISHNWTLVSLFAYAVQISKNVI